MIDRPGHFHVQRQSAKLINIEDPPELKAKGLQDNHDRALSYTYASCYSCWYNYYYGWITYCCTYYGYCGYYYC